jgi:hypothetical protein
VRGMQLIGMNVDLTLITDKPSTLFFWFQHKTHRTW